MTEPGRIYILIDKFAAGAASDAEQEELAALLEDPAGAEDARQYLLRILEQTPALPGHSQERWQAIRAAIEPQQIPSGQPAGRPSKAQTNKIRHILRWSAAAALLGGIVATIFLLPVKKSGTPPPAIAVKHDRPPGGNVATLTLGDGSRITLDSAVNGVLAEQGNTKIAKLGNGQLAYNTLNEKPAALLFNTLATPRGGQYRLILPDGTGVWLNAASSITYPTDFTGNERVVRITGEVYFEVRKDPVRPFHVAFNTGADSGKIEVLGTRFNISAYKDEGVVKATLLEGSVKVVAKESTFLKPGQQVQLNNEGHASPVKEADLEDVMAWKNGFFHFERTDIGTVMRQIARWYDVDVVFEGQPTNEKFDGDIPRNSQLTDVFKILELSKVHFKVEDKKVTVMP
jgi:ferric-dicitrate binding protein FerR (iron transport regulator)